MNLDRRHIVQDTTAFTGGLIVGLLALLTLAARADAETSCEAVRSAVTVRLKNQIASCRSRAARRDRFDLDGCLTKARATYERSFARLTCALAPTVCNGSAANCDRRFDQVVFPTTHNSFSKFQNFRYPNQLRSIEDQLKSGIRGLMLDVYLVDGAVRLCHEDCKAGSTPFSATMGDIKKFLDDNPAEVVTLILQSEVEPGDLAAAMKVAAPYLYEHAGEWRTLGDMIFRQDRLVVFASNVGSPNTMGADPDLPWLLSEWSLASETPYSYGFRELLGPGNLEYCRADRGVESGLFILNHFITPSSHVTAARVNTHDFLLESALWCRDVRGRLPNFLVVDWENCDSQANCLLPRGHNGVPDVVHVADELNAGGVDPDCHRSDPIVPLPTVNRGVGSVPSVCGEGEEASGPACYPVCRAGYVGAGPTCMQRCAAGYADDGLTCRKDDTQITAKSSYGRGAGSVPNACRPGEERSGALCYPACAPGYYGVGPVCWQSCPAGYADDGATCRRDAHIFSSDNSSCPWYDTCGVTLARGCSTCPAGYSNDGCTCRRDAHIFGKNSYGRGVGSASVCAAGLQADGGLCYQPCAAGYRNVGPVCWQICPAGWTDDGAFCRRGGVTIVSKSVYGRGVGSLKRCEADRHDENGLCYLDCPAGLTGVGPTCVAACPSTYTEVGPICVCR